MKRLLILTFLFFCILPGFTRTFSDNIDNDTVALKNLYLDEVVIVSNPKSDTKLFEFPGSISAFGEKKLEQMNITSLKDLSSLAPNLFIPDYGSKLISSVYIRGIGSRINSPAVGLNVDNVPYLDKSCFDFDFMDIERIEVLRGPQGTLYGRNTMAGQINVYTKSPFNYQGTKVNAGYGNYNAWNAAISHHQKVNEKVAFSLNGRYRKDDGYFDNTFTNRRSGTSEVAGGRAQLNWRLNRRLKIDFASDFEYSNQDGYPYRLYNDQTKTWGDVHYNDDASYERKLSSNSILLQYIHDRYILSSTTGYQYLDDKMNLDQDFTEKQVFTLTQKQRQHSVTQEVAFKSNTTKNFQWVAGVFGFYQHLNTSAPVDFKSYGIQKMIVDMTNNQLKKIKENNPNMPVDLSIGVNQPNILIDGQYKTPTFGLAVFKQVTFNNLFTEGFSATVGLRLDYEHVELKHNTYAPDSLRADLKIKMPPHMGGREVVTPLTIPLEVSGKDKMDFLELLPKFELKYVVNKQFFTYASVAKGYRSGGYNIQMFSNIIQKQMQTGMMEEAKKKMPPNVTLPDMGGASTGEDNMNDVFSYKPEHSWNYEVGARADLMDNRLFMDFSAFFIDCRNQQVSVVSGYGRITKNSGRSTSKGVEASIRYLPIDQLRMATSYGFTHATFKENHDGKISYNGNFVPFAPLHTFSASADYTLTLNKKAIDKIVIGAQFTGKGKIYWTEANNVSQGFYGLLNAEVSLIKKGIELSFWGKNLTNTRYQAFYFETMNADDITGNLNGFVQQGRPLTFGGSLTWKF